MPATAADEPWAAAVVRRARRFGALWLLIGIALFIGCGTAANYIVSDSDQLRADGGQVAGQVAATRGFQRGQDSEAKIVYAVGGHRYERRVDLGNKPRDYQPGQYVTVYYDRDNPDHMTIDDVNNQSAWTVLPMAIAFVGGLGGMVLGSATLVGARRDRHALRASTW